MDYLRSALNLDQADSLKLLALATFSALVFSAWTLYILLYLLAPIPRAPLPLEKKYRSIEADGNLSVYEDLPCWHDKSEWGKSAQRGVEAAIEKAEVFMSLVVPAYNEEERLNIMLREAVDYLEDEYGVSRIGKRRMQENGSVKQRHNLGNGHANGHSPEHEQQPEGWEILIVSDGSTDRTTQTALAFAKSLGAEAAGKVRVVELHQNRGKGGAVTHGLKHVRGRYAIFADADGASKFEDLGKLVTECARIEEADKAGRRAVAVGSRAHLVGSEAVVKRSFLRNLLMHSFHILLRFMTPTKTAAIKDTQCGFKLFSRAALPYIIPFMHSEGWIFDVEMLMLAESAGIPVVEVPVGWKEVKGSKLNVLWDSLGMAWGLFVLRAAWGLGIYSR